MSGRTFSFEINLTSCAPAATLFALETDGARWSEWAKPIIMSSTWAQQGDPAPGGHRRHPQDRHVAHARSREDTGVLKQDRRHVYALVAPSTPAKDYRGEAVFTPNASGGTDIRWSGSFTEVF